MREIVIVIADLFLPPNSDDASRASDVADSSANAAGSSSAISAPGLQHAARFGQKRSLAGEGGWRAWLARSLGRHEWVTVPPAVIAAAALDSRSDSASTVWLATPLHRIAGLTSVHLDRRSLLRLSAEETQGFVTDFNRTFGDDSTSFLRLHALPTGALLLEAPADMVATTTDPARALAFGLEDSLPKGPQATPFKRLGAEVEMWLHAHPLNTFRTRRGELPVNAFWLWGGGRLGSGPQPSGVSQTSGAARTSGAQLLGIDPYLAGLAHLGGLPVHPLPSGWGDLPNVADNQRTILVAEISPLLHSNPNWSVFDAMADLDRRFIAPALAALHAGAVERLILLVNDIELGVRRHDRRKFWRRPKSILAGLTSSATGNV